MYYPILLIYHCSDNRANEGFRGRQNMYYPNILEMHYPSAIHPFVKKLISRKFTAIDESQVRPPIIYSCIFILYLYGREIVKEKMYNNYEKELYNFTGD